MFCYGLLLYMKIVYLYGMNGILEYKYKNRKLIMRNRKSSETRLKGKKNERKKKSYFYGCLNLMYCNMFIYVTYYQGCGGIKVYFQ